MRQRIKPWILPISMLGGVLFHDIMGKIDFIAPYLIFVMLLITFCKVRPSELRITRLSWMLMAVQVFGAIAVYTAIRPWSEDIAQGAFICMFCPTATAAPVITGMLGGSVPRLATFSIVSNITVALLAPLLFTQMTASADSGIDIASTTLTIGSKVAPLIIIPMVLAFTLLYTAPKVHRQIAQRQSLSFYIWAVSLFIVVGRAISFIMAEPSDKINEMLLLAAVSGVLCCMQFWIGRRIGHRCGDRIVGAQGLGQKNTVLAIWMALTFLNPICSVAPAAYVAWQNIINSYQLYRKSRHGGTI
ncbi:MAG: transporter [Muribaculaceae bacterium]|nr:transporter [Muribaculaceae bacterium]